MRVVLQRVNCAAVTVNGAETRQTGAGLMVLVGIRPEDDEAVSAFMAEKMLNLRIMEDENGNMNRSLLDTGGECMVISNFTLYANSRKGRRPSFVGAAPPEQAEAIYEHFVGCIRQSPCKKVETGEFGAEMQIDMTCAGPVTILLDSDEIMPKQS